MHVNVREERRGIVDREGFQWMSGPFTLGCILLNGCRDISWDVNVDWIQRHGAWHYFVNIATCMTRRRR
ncbi:hypothetical protein C8T65DRAFT_629581 [Cerioporus squamosus]|nr:hypothetical protein C8T65DRAFT_629581 [Cerioporus squamosus]